MKRISRIILILLTVSMFFSLISCKSEEQIPENTLNYDTYLQTKELDKEYVYMWNKNPINYGDPVVCFQTPTYALTWDGSNGKFLNMGNYISLSDKLYSQCDFDALPAVTTQMSVDVDGKTYLASTGIKPKRTANSTRNMQLVHQPYLAYENLSSDVFTSRVEVAAMLDHFVIMHEAVTKSSSMNINLRMQLGLEGYYPSFVYEGRGLRLLDAKGNGFVFLKPLDSELYLNYQNGILTIEKNDLALNVNKYDGFSVLVFPVQNKNMQVVDDFLLSETLEFYINSAQPYKAGLNSEVKASYVPEYGYYSIDYSNLYVGVQSNEASRHTYETVDFTIVNNTNRDLSPTILFVKKANLSHPTGISAHLRDPETGMPTGEPVNLTRNWDGAFKEVYGGTWSYAYSSLEVKAGQSLNRELVTVYGMWGETYAAMHAMGCNIGYNDNAQLDVWDISVLGSWGETVTYDPDMSLGRSMIDDVRGFLIVSEKTGAGKEYNWTGNVGGAHFLNYLSEYGEQRIAQQKIYYKTQGPNLTHTNYFGITYDGKIATDITINLGRTNDIVRNYYTIKYTFLEDVEYYRLSFFQLAADNYSDNLFKDFAYGDETGVKYKGTSAEAKIGAMTEFELASGENFWYSMFNSSDKADENADVMMIVRDYNATINGKNYDKPAFRLYGTQNGSPQVSCELGVPSDVKVVEQGSVIEIKLEYDIIPNNVEDYYGDSEYVLASGNILGTAEAMMQQVLNGKTTVNVQNGKLVENYPITIAMNKGEEEILFKLTGGLGYVPLRFTNLNGYNYKLQQKVNGNFVDVDQSVRGNDFWQTYRDPKTGLYELSYNVVNTIGTNYLEENEYRLVKM